MKHVFIQRQHTPRLLLLFAGWGMDTTPFQSMERAGSDLLVCYDYRTLTFDEELCRSYQEITLIAWSMGVWAATQLLQNSSLPITRCIAINGTPYPIDDLRGIPTAIFQGTLAGLNDATLAKFQRRMCGSASAYQQFLAVAPTRPIEELKEELQAIATGYATLPPATLPWESARVGSADRIFPAENQLRAWEGVTPVREIEAAHYAAALFDQPEGELPG